ncbi:MAG: hypothetical protein OXC02_01870 [Rhodobacteraceae bacterium]|nr:hypothetical protein [Paracoccaceae bacterium]
MSENQTKYSFKGQSIVVKVTGSEQFVRTQVQELTRQLIQLDSAVQSKNSTQPESTIAEQFNFADEMRKFASDPAKNRFLAIALLLHRQGKNRIATGDIHQAVKDYKLNSFVNASDCRARCIKEGLIAQDAKKFYVTQKGAELVGIPLTIHKH